jgi:hypothetical protein
MCSACGYEERNSFGELLDHELERDFEKEAFDIIAGRASGELGILRQPTREHLIALRSYFIRGMNQLAGVAPEPPLRDPAETPTQPTKRAQLLAQDAAPLPPYIHSKYSF